MKRQLIVSLSLVLCSAPAWTLAPPVPPAAAPPVPVAEEALDQAELVEQVKALLQEQAAAWNAGDLEAFCSAYQEDVTFISPSGLTQGRQGVLERYRKRYPDRAAMGHLTLEVEEVRLAKVPGATDSSVARISVAGASLAARWRLSYEDREDAAGWTLLVLHRSEDGRWRIVQDASF
jgi:uncharacterized protein (TIGR02246 family)